MSSKSITAILAIVLGLIQEFSASKYLEVVLPYFPYVNHVIMTALVHTL